MSSATHHYVGAELQFHRSCFFFVCFFLLNLTTSGYRSAGALHPPLHQRQPEPTGSRESAEAQSEEWIHPRSSAAENLQGLRSGGSVCTPTGSDRTVGSSVYCTYTLTVVFITGDTAGDAWVLPLHPGHRSEFVAVPGPLHGAFWWARVPTLIHCVRLLLPSGGCGIYFSLYGV